MRNATILSYINASQLAGIVAWFANSAVQTTLHPLIVGVDDALEAFTGWPGSGVYAILGTVLFALAMVLMLRLFGDWIAFVSTFFRSRDA